MLLFALAVIGQDFDHAAFGNAPVAASFDHKSQFSLESRETANTLSDLFVSSS